MPPRQQQQGRHDDVLYGMYQYPLSHSHHSCPPLSTLKVTMDDIKVQVITAGGAANAKKKKKSKKKKTGDTIISPSSSPKRANKSRTMQHDAGAAIPEQQNLQNSTKNPPTAQFSMEMETSDREQEHFQEHFSTPNSKASSNARDESFMDETVEPVKMETLIQEPPQTTKSTELFWLLLCFAGIMASFVVYGVLLEYTTSGGRKLHELSFLFVTSGLYTITAAAGRYVRAETPTTIPPARFAILGLTSMGSTFCSVRSLR